MNRPAAAPSLAAAGEHARRGDRGTARPLQVQAVSRLRDGGGRFAPSDPCPATEIWLEPGASGGPEGGRSGQAPQGLPPTNGHHLQTRGGLPVKDRAPGALPTPNDTYENGEPVMTLIPNGTVITDEETLYTLFDHYNLPVVTDRSGNPWILFATDDGDDWAITAECPDDGIPTRTDLYGLITRGPLRLVYNGLNRDDQWPTSAVGEVPA